MVALVFIIVGIVIVKMVPKKAKWAVGIGYFILACALLASSA